MKKSRLISHRAAIALPGLLLIGALSLSLTQCLEDDNTVSGSGEIRLVVQITVDGLRGDLIERYRGKFGEGGFNRLLRTGSVCTNAHYQHANTETIVGHTTLATGTTPAIHGMIGNAWFDPASGSLAYNIEDSDHPVLPTRDEITDAAEVDPSKMAVRSSGRSPRNILVPTFSDTLSIATGGKAKILAVSGKDRSAVAMAGHCGKAFWFDTGFTDFVTSSYYLDEYPDWVSEWNATRKPDSHAGTQWALTGSLDNYLHGDRDDRPYEVDLKGFGRTFPHTFGSLDHPLFPTQLVVSPVMDELVADFASTAITKEAFGADAITDYLSLSFSSTDAVQHFFGPGSLESEVTIRRLDQTLEKLFRHIDETVGLKHTLIILSADHGMPEMPEFASSLGYQAGRITPEQIVTAANDAGKTLGLDQAVKYFFRPYLYLDQEAIQTAGLDADQVAESLAAAITSLEGIHLATASAHPEAHRPAPLRDKILNNHCEGRSGDLYVFQDPYWFLMDKGPVACMHGSPWSYDTHVPVIFSGPGVRAQSIEDTIHPADVAPTLSRLLGISPPASATGSAIPGIKR